MRFFLIKLDTEIRNFQIARNSKMVATKTTGEAWYACHREKHQLKDEIQSLQETTKNSNEKK